MSADCLSNEQYPLPNFELVADAALLGGHGSKLRSSLSHREHSPVYINDCLHSGPHPLWSTSGEYFGGNWCHLVLKKSGRETLENFKRAVHCGSWKGLDTVQEVISVIG